MRHVTLMALGILVGVISMPIVNFEGKQFKFPDGTSQEEMGKALDQYIAQGTSASQALPTPDSDAAVRSERTNIARRESYVPKNEDGTDGLFPDLPPLSGPQAEFATRIAEIETGGLDNRFVRTGVKPQPGQPGSSAYGTYQITRGLLRGTLEQELVNFTPAEREAAQELIERQEIALTIGGVDRKTYQKGGPKYGLALRWARQYGYEDVESFLTDFDYKGTLGLADDGDFQVLYESFARKMLNKTLEQAGGDELLAAGIWHGGENKRKWSASTRQYQNKMRLLQGN